MVVFCDSILRTRNIAVDILAIFFGISSWISINGLWVELPLLVDKLPEGWNLASYLSIIVQIANLGPISVALLRWRLKDKFSSSWIIVLLLILGSASSLMMVTFWQRTSSIGGVDHSTALFTLVFFLSLVDCTSSVLFLPFMGIFKDIYLNSYLVGEGLSGFVPSIAALIQGVGGNPYCENVTITYANGTEVRWPVFRISPQIILFSHIPGYSNGESCAGSKIFHRSLFWLSDSYDDYQPCRLLVFELPSQMQR